jgi:hypothetical protein
MFVPVTNGSYILPPGVEGSLRYNMKLKKNNFYSKKGKQLNELFALFGGVEFCLGYVRAKPSYSNTVEPSYCGTAKPPYSSKQNP